MRPIGVLIPLLAAGCVDTTSSRSGAEALIILSGAQFVPGAMPAESGGPKVNAINSVNNSVPRGLRAKRLSGDLDQSATAVAIGFEGDVGYWIKPAGGVNVENPPYLLFDATAAFSAALQPGPRALVYRAVDEAGRFGAPKEQTLAITGAPVENNLVVSLTWNNQADLDLHVIPPNNVEVWARHPASWNNPGDREDHTAEINAAGYLDGDSNAQCVLDGRRMENVIWARDFDGGAQMPPAGHYIVRVDAPSLCGQSNAMWTVEVFRAGASIAVAHGNAGEAETRGPHEAGAGILALEFDL